MKNITYTIMSLLVAGMSTTIIDANSLEMTNITQGPVAVEIKYTVPAFCLNDSKNIPAGGTITLNTRTCAVAQLTAHAYTTNSKEGIFRPINGEQVRVNISLSKGNPYIANQYTIEEKK